MIIAGIDPGKGGALAIDYGDGFVECFDVPKARIKGKDGKPLWLSWKVSWSTALALAGPGLVVVEDVSAMPKQGVTSMFNFGRTLGFIHSIALGCNARVEFVTPAVWKRKMGLVDSSKDASRELFRTLWPNHADQVTRVKDDGRAEAALLAHYGRKFL